MTAEHFWVVYERVGTGRRELSRHREFDHAVKEMESRPGSWAANWSGKTLIKGRHLLASVWVEPAATTGDAA